MPPPEESSTSWNEDNLKYENGLNNKDDVNVNNQDKPQNGDM